MPESLRPVSAQELALFSERIGRSLAERPLEITVGEHRERVASLLREVGGATFYQLLSVGPAASPERVHEGYERLARLVHPMHAQYLGLEGMEGVLEVLFERATAAYITLSHPGRRRDYDREIGPEGWMEATDPQQRGEQNRDRARGYYNRAVGFAAKEEYHFAIELLREAVRLDPQAKYYLQLAELQTKNEHWLRHAADSYQRVLELGGPDPQVEEALARVRRRMGEIAAGSPIRDRERAGAGGAAPPGLPDLPPGANPLAPPTRYEIEADLPAPDDDLPPERP
jgi:tetratricopeptide (TPR) repeat protein